LFTAFLASEPGAVVTVATFDLLPPEEERLEPPLLLFLVDGLEYPTISTPFGVYVLPELELPPLEDDPPPLEPERLEPPLEPERLEEPPPLLELPPLELPPYDGLLLG
jgi:hypothetical protein